MIFAKSDASTNGEQVEKWTSEFNIHCRSCIGSLIYFLSTRVYLSFAVHKLAKFSSNIGKVKFEGLVYLLIYTIDDNTWGLNYYDDIQYSLLSDLLRQASIKTENQLIYFYDSSCKYFPDNVRSTGAYIIFYEGVPIDHVTHVPWPVAQ